MLVLVVFFQIWVTNFLVVSVMVRNLKECTRVLLLAMMAFCTTSNENKLEVVATGINLNANIYICHDAFN